MSYVSITDVTSSFLSSVAGEGKANVDKTKGQPRESKSSH